MSGEFTGRKVVVTGAGRSVRHGTRPRIWILGELIRHARSKGDVWFATHAEVTEWARLK